MVLNTHIQHKHKDKVSPAVVDAQPSGDDPSKGDLGIEVVEPASEKETYKCPSCYMELEGTPDQCPNCGEGIEYGDKD